MKINFKELYLKYFGQIMNTKTLLIIFIVGMVLLLLPSGRPSEPKEVSNVNNTSKEEIETELETILSKIKGAGKVDVMITLEDNGATHYAQDEQYRSGDSEKTTEKSHVFSKKSSTEEPLIIKRTEPKISGILVCAEGAGNPQVKSNIISAASALLGIKSHRIEVLERG